MNCETYQDLVAAHVDGQLSPDERQDVQEHLSGCQECQQLFAEQQAFTKAFQTHSLLVPVPDELEHRLRAALAEENTGHITAWQRTIDWFADRFSPLQLPRFGWGLAAAGVVVLLVLPLFPRLFPTVVSDWLGLDSEPNIFASAVTSYQEIAEGNPSLAYPVQEPMQLQASFHRSGQLDFDIHVLDLRQVGFQLRGGTIRHTATQPVAAAIYDNGAEHILCLRQHGQMPVPPAGGEWKNNSYLYTQGGYTVILTQFSDHFCALISGLPPDVFLRTIRESAR